MRVGRFIAWLFLSIGVGFLGWAVIGYFQQGKFEPDPLGKVWATIHSPSLLLFQPAVERHLSPWIWSNLIQPVLETPAYVDFLVLGAVLALLFRRRRGRAG